MLHRGSDNRSSSKLNSAQFSAHFLSGLFNCIHNRGAAIRRMFRVMVSMQKPSEFKLCSALIASGQIIKSDFLNVWRKKNQFVAVNELFSRMLGESLKKHLIVSVLF